MLFEDDPTASIVACNDTPCGFVSFGPSKISSKNVASAQKTSYWANGAFVAGTSFLFCLLSLSNTDAK